MSTKRLIIRSAASREREEKRHIGRKHGVPVPVKTTQSAFIATNDLASIPFRDECTKKQHIAALASEQQRSHDEQEKNPNNDRNSGRRDIFIVRVSPINAQRRHFDYHCRKLGIVAIRCTDNKIWNFQISGTETALATILQLPCILEYSAAMSAHVGFIAAGSGAEKVKTRTPNVPKKGTPGRQSRDTDSILIGMKNELLAQAQIISHNGDIHVPITEKDIQPRRTISHWTLFRASAYADYAD